MEFQYHKHHNSYHDIRIFFEGFVTKVVHINRQRDSVCKGFVGLYLIQIRQSHILSGTNYGQNNTCNQEFAKKERAVILNVNKDLKNKTILISYYEIFSKYNFNIV